MNRTKSKPELRTMSNDSLLRNRTNKNVLILAQLTDYQYQHLIKALLLSNNTDLKQ